MKDIKKAMLEALCSFLPAATIQMVGNRKRNIIFYQIIADGKILAMTTFRSYKHQNKHQIGVIYNMPRAESWDYRMSILVDKNTCLDKVSKGEWKWSEGK